MDNKIKHLEMIQGVINRIADHKPQFKGWFITLIVAINILDASNLVKNQITLMLIISFSFLCISSYYLYLERLYIELFNKVRKDDEVDFDMNTSDYRHYKKYINSLTSMSNLIYYVAIGICIYFLLPCPILSIIVYSSIVIYFMFVFKGKKRASK